jgi:DNA-binding NtrC family response regulator
MRYDWPGNVRELQNVAERALLLSDDADQDTSMVFLPQALIRAVHDSDGASGETMALEAELDGGLKAAVAKLEREIIDRLLEQYGGDQDAVMEKLGISRSTLWRKVSE